MAAVHDLRRRTQRRRRQQRSTATTTTIVARLLRWHCYSCDASHSQTLTPDCYCYHSGTPAPAVDSNSAATVAPSSAAPATHPAPTQCVATYRARSRRSSRSGVQRAPRGPQQSCLEDRPQGRCASASAESASRRLEDPPPRNMTLEDHPQTLTLILEGPPQTPKLWRIAPRVTPLSLEGPPNLPPQQKRLEGPPQS